MANSSAPRSITLRRPDDWHIHLRDGLALKTTAPHAALDFKRLICMPNLRPPVTTVDAALKYREQILAHAPSGSGLDPLMVLYLTDNMSPEEVLKAQGTKVTAVKLYPAGATTNSDSGLTKITNAHAVFEAMQSTGMPLLIHGEVTDAHVDIFDREKQFIDTVMQPLQQRFPELKIVFEHITTKDAAEFVASSPDTMAATITPQHLIYSRNDLLVGGIRPHRFCLPVLKREAHRQALVAAATSGSDKFFLGTDSAPHASHTKETSCGCAGCYTAPHAMALYADVFDQAGKLDQLEAFASLNGPKFYGLDPNQETLTLTKIAVQCEQSFDYLEGQSLTPLMAGETLPWQVTQRSWLQG